MDGTFTSDGRPEFGFVVLSPPGPPDATLPIAGSRAGALGVLNLEFARDDVAARAELARLAASGRGGWGALIDDEALLEVVLGERPDGLETIVLPARGGERIARLVALVHGAGLAAFAVATDLDQALAAEAAGADAVIAKGHEAGGWIGEEGSFVLLQRLVAALSVPVWAHGGVGLHTAGAAYVAGAAGAVLDSQLLLVRESPLAESARAAVAAMDGSETLVLGAALGMPVRVHGRRGPARPGDLREAELRLGLEEADVDTAHASWRAAVAEHVSWRDGDNAVAALGQDAAFAADLARRFETVGGVLAALRAAIASACATTGRENPLAEGGPLARSHGTRYPIVQGPMTRVSDRAEFAAAVAEGGGLPFLALALMRAAEVDALLEATKPLLGERPWGVGILGFVPQELRAEQLEVVRRHRPPFAVIAGGRPDQARVLEDDGITTYLHVPSPGLLRLYLADGARRFVFEGRECGGHVGPRTSLVLWDTMARVLLEELPRDATDCHVLLAGGIHDARSAAMAAATAAPLAARGVRVGALLGTAYLFTPEATECGAITPTFQEAAIAGRETVLLESGPGHATRCLPSPFVAQFEAERRRLRADEVPSDELRARLEQLNIGRLRIAAKGADRHPRHGQDPDAPKLTTVDADEQWERGLYMIGQVAALRGARVPLAELHADIAAGSTELLRAIAAPAEAEPPAPPPADVAIIGVGCILPGARDARELWSNILGKVDAISEVPADRWDWRRYYDPDPAARDKVSSRWGGFVDAVPFDPIAFGLPPNSLRSIEPFQLLALLTAQAALRDAGYETRPFHRERTSVILGAGGGGADLSVGYTVRSALPSLLGDADAPPGLGERLHERLPEWTEDSFPGLLMNVAAGRIANRLDLGGANFTVDAACASSLTAASLAVRELQAGTSDMVLAGGIDAIQNPFAYLCFSKTHALSPNGRCRPFDAEADGIAISEGFATVVLKRLADAERDGDRIYAVIRGAGAASDGRDRSLTAPRPEGQVRALRRAYAQARISPATVELVEAHGTGTVAGDGAEVQALSQLFGEYGTGTQWCAIGSVKSMIGHTKATAGVAGLVKAALALHHRVLPPTIGVTQPNPKANFPASPFYVNTEARPWIRGVGDHPRRAGVSAFGFGGTDFHIVLEEYTGSYVPEHRGALDRWPAELLVWRGTREGIVAALDALAARLDAGAEPAVADLARTTALEAGAPRAGEGTLAVVAESLEDLRAKLPAAREALAGDAVRVHLPHGIHWSERPLAADGRVAFLFPGQGSQAVDMARDVALAFPEARECFERADRVLADHYDQPLSRFVLPPPSFSDEERRRRQAELTDTHVAQPALGVAGLAYLAVLRSLGVEPEMAAGHSYGEFVALAAAGGLGEDDLLRLSEARGRFMAEAAGGEPGAMAAVDAAPEALRELLDAGDVVAANLNAPEQTVLSGAGPAIEAALEWCAQRGIRARALPVACAFHSPLVAPAQRRLAELLGRTPLAPARIPVFSNTTAEAHAEAPEAIAEVLGEHLARPVRFVDEIEAMHRDGARVFVEAGPRAVLSGLVERILGEREHLAVPVDRNGRPGLVQLLHCLAALAAEGVPVRLERLFEGRSAERLDPSELRSPNGSGALPPSAWLVDGGRARPAVPPASGPTHAEEQPHVTTSSNGAAAAPAAPQPPSRAEQRPPATPGDGAPGAARAPAAPLPTPAAPPPARVAPVGGDRTAEVMGRYQDVMQHFLDTQRDVMLAYLGTPRSTPVERPAAAPPPAALPAPPPAAVAPPAPAAGPPEVAPTVHRNGHTALSGDEIRVQLLTVVSERTGYPTDMLPLDADLEGDLGIDSIKRVEIAGTLTQTVGLPDGATLDIEQITASRTLRQVIAALEATITPGAQLPAAAGAATAEGEDERPFEQGPAEEERIGRFVVQPTSAPAIAARGDLAADGAVVIIDDGTGVGEALADALARGGRRAVRLAPGDHPEDDDGAARLAERVRAEHGGAAALVHLAALGADAHDAGIASLLLVAQALRIDLEHAAAAGGAAVLGATGLGGAFGLQDGAPAGVAVHGAIPGFLKSLAQEWPAVRVKAVDLAPDAPDATAERLLDELTAADGLVEVGYRDGRRLQPELVPAATADRPAASVIDGDCVLLVTGGARGITAEVALDLARRARPTLVLVGRTPAGDAEDPATAGLADLPDLRRAFIELRRSAGEDVTPAIVEEDCRSLLRRREVRDNLARMRATGARVDYLTCDVSDAAALGALVDGVYERHGRIDGVIHGAGVIEDRLVRDKRRDSLERVMAAKAGSALTLGATLRPETLRFLVLFSSVSGRFGNRGQADYAAASEVLNKLADELDRRWPGRVVSVNWGPWRTTGMVSPEVERQFASRGVSLIPVDAGCRLMDEELRRGRKGEVEVVIGAAAGVGADDAAADRSAVPHAATPDAATPDAATPDAAGADAAAPDAAAPDAAAPDAAGADAAAPDAAAPDAAAPDAAGADAAASAQPLLADATRVTRMADGGLHALRTLELGRDRYLDDHRVDGRPVLPFAVAMELMAEAAAAARPDLEVAGLREIRVLQGVTVDDGAGTRLQVTAGPRGSAAELEAAIEAPEARRPHYRAVVDLRAPHDDGSADESAPAPLDDLAPFPMPVEEAYRDLLFHGPLFQAIAAIEGMDARGARALLRPSAPARCLAGEPAGRWLLDPVMLDAALQLQVLWARLQWDVTLLPAEIGSHHRTHAMARDGIPGDGLVRLELRVAPAAAPPLCRADHWFYGPDGRLLATLGGVVGVGSKALNRLATARP